MFENPGLIRDVLLASVGLALYAAYGALYWRAGRSLTVGEYERAAKLAGAAVLVSLLAPLFVVRGATLLALYLLTVL